MDCLYYIIYIYILKINSEHVEGVRLMRVSELKFCFSEKEEGIVWKDFLNKMMSGQNGWDHDVEGNVVDGPVECVSRDEVVQALNEMKTGKKPTFRCIVEVD